MSPRLANALLVASLILTALVALQLHGLKSGLDLLVRSGVDVTQHASASWREVGGVQYSMRTYRDPSEDATEFVDRHEEAVLALSKRIGRKGPDAERYETR